MSRAVATLGSETLDVLAEVIGEEAAFALAWEFRGLQLYVPKDPAVEPGIAKAIGAELAARLCEHFWRTTLYLPMREATRRQVHHLAKVEGLSRQEIARRLRIAERQVYRLLESPPLGSEGAPPRDDRQLAMF